MARRIPAILAATFVLFWARAGAADGADAHVDETERSPEIQRSAEGPRPDVARPRAASPLPDGFVPGSSYGWRTSPRTGRRTFHAGLDFLAPRGTDVRAAVGGVVERVTRDHRGRTRFGGYGRAIVIRHARIGVWTFYAHLDAVSVEVGETVAAGQVIGAVGNSTNHRFRGMPTHLHFEVRHAARGDRSPFPGPYRRYNVDPAAWLRALGVRFGDDDEDVEEPRVQPS